MTNTQIREAEIAAGQINKVADQVLARLGKQTGGDVHIAIAALAVAICSLARAADMEYSEMLEAVRIAQEQLVEAL
jgi:hypothetical protein